MGQLRLPGQTINYSGPNLTPRRPNPKPWHQRITWAWLKTKTPPPVPPGVEWWWKRSPDWNRYNNGQNIFEPYRRPIVSATGGGTLYQRQFAALQPNIVFNQTGTPVSITGDGSELQGQFTVLPLVDTQSSSGGSEVVSVSTQNGVTNIQLGNTVQPGTT